MKNLLKKLLFGESPAEGAVFSTLLFWLGTWCLASVFLIADGFAVCFPDLPGAFRIWAYRPSFAWPHLLLIAEGLLCFYHLIVTGRFYRQLTREKRPFGKYVLAGILLLTFASMAFFRSRAPFLIGLYLLWCWAVPLLFMPKQWKWLIPAALAPLCFLPMAATFIGTVVVFLRGDEFPAVCRWRLPNAWLFYLLCLFAVFCVFCRLKACAGTAGRSLRALFGKGAKGICGVFLLTYLVTLGMAFAAHCQTERHVAELEKFFGRPVTAQGLKELYFQDRKPDAAFWQKVTKLNEPVYRMPWVACPESEFTPAEFAACKRRFDNYAELRELEKLFSAAPPAYDRKLAAGCLFMEMMPDLRMLRNFCLYELWRTRFALADKDPAAALAAVKRMKFCRDYLARDPVLISALVLTAVEKHRLDALELLLSSGLLTEEQLLEMRKELAACREEMKKIHLHAVYGEAVGSMDVCHLFACGGTVRERGAERAIPGLYAWRWAFPAMWHVFTCSRDVLAQAYKTEDFFHLPYREERAVSHFFPRIMLAGLRAGGRRFHALTDRYLAMETLIGVELERRRTGKYPDALKNLPEDSFGEPLLYRKGKLPFIRRWWDAEKKQIEAKKVMVDIVAVWSKGPNRKDDRGLYEKVFSEDGTPDDSRAFLFLNMQP